MNKFILTIEATTTFSGGNAPQLDIDVDSVVSSQTMVLGSSTYIIELEYDELLNFPSSISFSFNGSSGDPGDTISIDSVRINGQTISSGDLTGTLLTQGSSESISSTSSHDHLFGRLEPLSSDLGTVTVSGTGSDDRLDGTDGADVIDGGAGNDRLRGVGDDDAINGGDGDDTIFGEDGNDIIIGGTGNDTIFGNAGDDLLHGQDDNDFLIGGAGNDVLNGGAGNDGMLGDDGDDILYGESGDDWVLGDAGNDTLYGDDGDDFVIGGAGADTMYGGADDDQMHGEDGDDTIYGDDGADLITGGAGADTLDGGDGDDLILGDADNDLIAGGGGNDTIYGGSGTDTLDYTNAAAGVTADLSTGGASDDGDGGTDTVYEIENITGSAHADILTGDGNANTISGNDGDDGIAGGDGNDVLNGGAGDDGLAGGDGADILNGGDDNDTLLGNAGADILNGGAGNDILYATAATVTLLDVNFDTGTDGFSYSDGGFGGSDPANADANGSRITTDGNNGLGALEVYLDGQNGSSSTNISGTVDRTITTGSTALENVKISFAYRHWMDNDTDTGDDSEVYFEFDGTIYNDAGASSYISQHVGDFEWWNADDDSGWVTVTIDLPDLAANTSYDFSFGILQTAENDATEDSYVRIDDVLLWSAPDSTDAVYSNTLNGGDGDDILVGSEGSDILNGDDGDDTIYSASALSATNIVTLVDVDFDTGLDGFTYSDGGFGGSDPANADANEQRITTDGNIGLGALEVYIDGLNGSTSTNISGTWDETITVGANDLTNVQITFSYRHWTDASTDNNEDSRVYFEFDGTIYDDAGGSSYLSDHQGGFFIGEQDTGWTTVTIDLPDLTALQSYDFSIGVFLSRENNAAEDTYVRIDDVTLTGEETLPGNETILNGGDGNDLLYASDGIDIFMFESDTAFGNLDIIYNFDEAGGDKVDLSDILSDAGYDPMTDAITDFVQFADVGAHTGFYVDTAGTGTFTGADLIGGTWNVQGLTDEAALEAAGTLITS